jgi:hypothetical protein
LNLNGVIDGASNINSFFSKEHNSNRVSISIGDSGQCKIISCGYWDNTLKIHSMDSLKEKSWHH